MVNGIYRKLHPYGMLMCVRNVFYQKSHPYGMPNNNN